MITGALCQSSEVAREIVLVQGKHEPLFKHN